MQIHEYQAKQLLSSYGVPTPRGEAVFKVEDAPAAAKRLGGNVWVVKAQIHAGGRGKAGGVKVSKSMAEVTQNATAILGATLVTPQTGREGRVVRRLLIEEGLDLAKELYFSLLIDRGTQRVSVLASLEGGMEIEAVAKTNPSAIFQESAEPHLGMLPFQAARLAQKLGVGFDGKVVRQLQQFILNAYRAFCALDCSMLEVNPLAITAEGRVLALDAKVSLDDNAVFRHPEYAELRDKDEENPLEIQAADADLSYVSLDGNIGCMVNGAGLAMGTMDIIKAHGGEPANFLDVGGGANQQRVETAFRIITHNPNVRCILINIFGGIVRCDIVARGVVAAFRSVGLNVPVVVRLEGAASNEAREVIGSAGLGGRLQMAESLEAAAIKCIQAASVLA